MNISTGIAIYGSHKKNWMTGGKNQRNYYYLIPIRNPLK